MVLDEDSQKYTTISTHLGLFKYTRLPFGISSAPAIFQRAIESLLKGVKNVAVYLDDIILTGESDAEHLKTLEVVLNILCKAGLRLKPSKCEFVKSEVVYLGHKISQSGLEPVKVKVEAIVGAPAPTNKTELQSFLGLLNYYGKFLPDLSTRLAPLHKMLKKDIKWGWETEQQNCFDSVKKLLTSAKVLAHYDWSKSLVLQCDASPYGVGAVLSQKGEDGVEKPIGFVSRTLNISEKIMPKSTGKV